MKDPTRAAKSYKEKNKVDKRLSEWAVRENVIVIAGHTHRPMFPDVGEVPYFNDGSCVHPRCITAIEILDGYILLVKWSIKTDKDGMLYIGRDILEGPTDINEYFNSMIRN